MSGFIFNESYLSKLDVMVDSLQPLKLGALEVKLPAVSATLAAPHPYHLTGVTAANLIVKYWGVFLFCPYSTSG